MYIGGGEFHSVIKKANSVLILILITLVQTGCAGKYFHDAGPPPATAAPYKLAHLPYHEYWTGIIFNGNKIGFSHFSIQKSEEMPDLFEVRSEAVLRFQFLMLDKKLSLKSYDLIGEDLSLKRFAYEYDIDGSTLSLTGEVKDNVLEVTRTSENHLSREKISVHGTIFPGSMLYLYPVVHGLEIGRTYSYDVYDSETQSIQDVTQEVMAYQKSDLFVGSAFKVRTDFLGQEMTSWIDASGRPLFERALGGVLLSGMESEDQAKRYLLESSMNKEETLLDFSLIRTEEPIVHPRKTSYLEVLISGIGKDLILPSDGRQVCDDEGDVVHCRIEVQPKEQRNAPEALSTFENEVYLEPSYTVPCRDPGIRSIAAGIVKDRATDLERINAILEWISTNIEQEPVDVFTALDVLKKKKAECQGHAYLFAAFARAVSIPTRVVNGIVYSEDFKGFLYHAWAESYIEGRWIAIDPTTTQVPADATHIKFIEGETISCLIPLAGIIGKVGIEVIRVE
jgi:hypothetical protein